MTATARRAGLLTLLVGLVGCHDPGPDPLQRPTRSWGSWLALLNLEDTRDADPARWRPLLVDADPALRARVARGLGRVRAPVLVPLLLASNEDERAPEVVRELVFALGQSGDPRAVAPVVSRASSDDPTVRAAALTALGKLRSATATPALLAGLADPEPQVRGAACLALARLRGRRVKPPLPWTQAARADALEQLAHLSRSDPIPSVRWRAVYALSNLDLPGRRRVLETALALSDARARLFAVQGLAHSKPTEAQRVALAKTLGGVLQSDTDVHVRASAARGLATHGGKASISVLMDACIDRVTPAQHHQRRTAVTALGQVLVRLKPPYPALAVAVVLDAAQADPSPTVRTAALRALAPLAPARLARWLQRDVKHTDAARREAAAAGAAALAKVDGQRATAWPLLLKLTEDAEPRVVAAALDGLGAAWDPKATPTLDLRTPVLAGLLHDDLAVRGTALSLLKKAGTPADRKQALVVLWASTSSEEAELRVEAVKVVAALGKADPAATALSLEGALDDRSPAVRRAAQTAITTLTGVAPKAEAVPAAQPSSVQLRLGQDVYAKTKNPRAVLQTSQGAITLELLREEAPRHVASFVRLARGRHYDGLTFHRVIAAFVAQGLDPRGDGWGTGGVFLRDEINPVPYLRGAVGMPNAGPDTGGCQLFITHVPTPHLDGNYTVFARVIEGEAALDALDVGDRVRSVRIAAGR